MQQLFIHILNTFYHVVHVQEIIEQFFDVRFAYLLLPCVLLKKKEGQDRYLSSQKNMQRNKQRNKEKSFKEKSAREDRD